MSKKIPRSEKEQFHLYLEKDLAEKLRKSAKDNRRPINSEVIVLLEKALKS